MAIFVGSGLGMFVKRKLSLTISTSLLLAISAGILLGIFNNITTYLSPISQSFIWFQAQPATWIQIIAGIILTILLVFLVMAVFIPMGQFLGAQFENSGQIVLYYSVNILFSLIGIWAFNFLSFLNFSPYLGIVAAQFALIYLTSNKNWNFVVLILISSLIMAGVSSPADKQIYWSPYQKLSLIKLPSDYFKAPGYQLEVNNVGFMGLLDLSADFKKSLIKKLESEKTVENFDIQFSNQYDLPYKLKVNPKNVLIIGAGGGNDAAAAVRAMIPSIDAVEIDPGVISLGRKYHPENPYSSPTVKITVDDGRSFLKKTKSKYDIVIMSLADSHTLNSSLNNIQLDNFLYTKESMAEVKNVLNPDGLVFISFDVRRPWIGAKIQTNLSRVFGHSPLVFSLQNELPLFGWGGVIFVQDFAKGQVENNLLSSPELKQFIDDRKLSFDDPVEELTDDWPYLYLDKPRFPTIHLIMSFGIMLFLIFAKNSMAQTGKFRWDSFLLGAGFLLFEFQNISKTSLLYGNTWTTNVYTISAVLVFILIANLISVKVKIPLKACYALLFLAFIIEIAMPISFFNQFSTITKYLISPLVLNLPLLFSGLIFINLFRHVRDRQSFFASNLIGSAFGGMLGFFSYLYGLKFLLYVSLLMYILSMISLWRSKFNRN
jgi:spermidine synthase